MVGRREDAPDAAELDDGPEYITAT